MIRLLITATLWPRYLFRLVIDWAALDKSSIRALKNKYLDQVVLVVGNGPSLNSTPLDKLDFVPSIGMNKIDLIFDRTTWRPDLVVCVNSMVVKQNAKAFSKSSIPIFLPTKARSMMGGAKIGHGGFFSINPTRRFSRNIEKGVGLADTVTYSALQFAYYTGAKTVVLLGVDHSYKTQQADAKKYERKQQDGQDHFDEKYFQKGDLWGIPDLEMSEYIYGLARTAFEEDGRQILDATVNGKLTVFDKISIEELFCLLEKHNVDQLPKAV